MERPSDPKRQELVARIEAIVRRMPRLTRDIFLAHRAQGMTCAEIARRTGLAKATASRLVAELVEHGFLERSGRLYILSPSNPAHPKQPKRQAQPQPEPPHAPSLGSLMMASSRDAS
jgi:predicted DNA-binding transcriptional regulator